MWRVDVGTAGWRGSADVRLVAGSPVVRIIRECDVNDKQVPPVGGQRRGSRPPAGRTPATAVAAL